MPEVEEIWQWMNEDYSEMTKERYEKFKEEEKITSEEVEEWAKESGVDSFKPASGVSRRGWTGHDIEFNLNNPYNEPWDCPCREQLEKLNPKKFEVPIRGFCEGCGASFTWAKGKWKWLWRYNNIERIEMSPTEYLGEGVTLDGFQDLIDRVKRLEKLVKDSHGCNAHDFFKILGVPEEKKPNYVKIDNIQINENMTALVTLKADGEKYQFGCSPSELTNPEEILNHWKEVVIPRRRAMEDVSIEELRESMKKLEGIRV